MMKRWPIAKRALVLLGGVVLVAACGTAASPSGGSSSGAPASQSAPAGTIKVGFIGPMTEAFAEWGQDHWAAAQMAVDEWNQNGGLLGQQIEFIKGDSQGDATQAAALANSFVDQGIKIVVGPTFSMEAEAAVPVFVQDKIIAVTGLADILDPNGNPGYYRVTLRTDNTVKFAKRMMLEYFKAKRLAILDDGRSDDVAITDLMREALAAEGITPVYSGTITAGQQDYSAALTQIRAQNPDVIFGALFHPEAALMRVQSADLGITAPWLLSAGGAENAFATIAGAKGVPTYCFQSKRDPVRYKAFADAYEAKYGRAPGNYNDYMYDAANVLFAAVQKAGSLDYDAVNKELGLTNMVGITGPLSFDKVGNRTTETYEGIRYEQDMNWHVLTDVPFDTP